MSGTANAEVRREMPLILIHKIPSKTHLVQTHEKIIQPPTVETKNLQRSKIEKNIVRICFAKVNVFWFFTVFKAGRNNFENIWRTFMRNRQKTKTCFFILQMTRPSVRPSVRIQTWKPCDYVFKRAFPWFLQNRLQKY